MMYQIKNYKGFVLNKEEGIEKGIFFRNPIQKVEFGTDDEFLNAYDYLSKIKNVFFKIWETIKGNRFVLKNVEEWSKDMSWAGFSANILCSPIYFRREYRKLEVISQNTNSNIQNIISYGYENEFNKCAGGCVIEKTKMKLKNGKTIRTKSLEKYNYTYEHVIQKLIDTEQMT